MSDRPSDGMTLDELREEFDWMSEFQSRMAERIRGDADVHSLSGYVSKLEEQNAKLREENQSIGLIAYELGRSSMADENAKLLDQGARLFDKVINLKTENERLRELAENLLMAFVVLETPKEQQKCIDRALDLRRELDVLPMETFDANELGVEVD